MILIALGSNLPGQFEHPYHNITGAIETLAKHGITPQKTSKIYKTVAWPDKNDPWYYNAVVSVETDLPPQDLMQTLHKIEEEFGRVREAENAPRTLDLDLIDYDGKVLDEDLRLPHPRMFNRAFVLFPLADIHKHWQHPKLKLGVLGLINDLYAETRDEIFEYNPANDTTMPSPWINLIEEVMNGQ